MDAKDNNLTSLPQDHNLTFPTGLVYPHCNTLYTDLVWLITQIIFVIYSFPANMIVIMELLKRKYKKRSVSSTSSLSEVFLLHISFINICYCAYILVVALHEVTAWKFNILYFSFLYSPSFSAVPLFLVAICVDCYLAVVYPVVYRTAKNLPHRGPLCTTLVWVYAFALSAMTIIFNISYFHPLNMMSFYVGLPAVVFFNISTLRALYSAGPGNTNQMLSPAKRRAFRVILSILVVMLVYYLPIASFYTYRSVVHSDFQKVFCFEIPLVMLISTVSGFATPLVFLYSVNKLGTTFSYILTVCPNICGHLF